MNAQRKILCPVCQVNFILKETKEPGEKVICPVCGAVLIMVLKQDQIGLERPKDISLEDEIRQRMDNFSRFRGYRFNEMKEALVEGLLKKHQRFGDFYCPCRIDNIQENVCPCIYTRQGDVEINNRCHCGLFWK